MIATAPGKVVVWGEYAVLQGAPAAVLAVNRMAKVTLEPRPLDWLFTSSGLLAPGLRTAQAQLPATPAARIASTILQFWGFDYLPEHFGLHSDSTPFFHSDRQKLGLGSSAAVCVATYRALAQLLQRPYHLDEVIEIHRALQDGRGSGMDVAASWHGGLTRFQEGAAAPTEWPAELHWCVVFTGASADTGHSVGHFNRWLQDNDDTPVKLLAQASEALWNAPRDLARWRGYTEALRALDAAAGLEIYTPAHEALAKLASAAELVYKPCGAGGGDIGLAVSHDSEAINDFVSRAQAQQFVPLKMEIATDGVRLRP